MYTVFQKDIRVRCTKDFLFNTVQRMDVRYTLEGCAVKNSLGFLVFMTALQSAALV